jgi:UDP-N-acetylmuramate--alanine ligase
MSATWENLLRRPRAQRRQVHIHLVGIGGTGLSPIATVLYEEGFHISGCDLVRSPYTEALTRKGVTIYESHAAEHLAGADIVLISSAIPPDNPEVLGARAAGLPVVKRAEFLHALMEGRRGIAVAGTHGKTTTTGMIAWLCLGLGLSPTFIVGSLLPDLERNAQAGTSDLFIIEADEYDHMFLGLYPHIAVVTNVEWDHPDCYPTSQGFRNAFVHFAEQVPSDGVIIGCYDDEGVRWVREHGRCQARWWDYGLETGAMWRATQVRMSEAGGSEFVLLREGQHLANVRLLLPGRHNVSNAVAALTVIAFLGGDVEEASRLLGQFHGASRRFEKIGESRGIIVVDDYGHHPTEIRATLAAARAHYPKREIWAVFQPHTFSRTRALLDGFVTAFDEAAHVVVMDVYPAREQDDGSIHAKDIVAHMRHHPDACYVGSLREVVSYLVQRMSPGSLLITFSAGDGHRVGQMVLAELGGRVGG